MPNDDRTHDEERARLGVPPLPLTADQVTEVVRLLLRGDTDPGLVALLAERVPPGVHEAAARKAAFLADIARGARRSAALDARTAVVLLGGMQGGFNVGPLVELLEDPALADPAADQLARTVLVFDAFDSVADLAGQDNTAARRVLASWAAADWFLERPAMPDELSLRVYRVDGEVTTDDLSPAEEAWCRADIPLHALSFLRHRVGPQAVTDLAALRALGEPVAFVADVVGTGSSRKSAVNSLVWHIGRDIEHVPNRRSGGVVLGRSIAPIFRDSLRDAGALAIECDVSRIAHGDRVVLRVVDGVVESEGRVLARFTLAPRWADEVRAGGRSRLLIGRRLTARARDRLGLPPSHVFAPPDEAAPVAGFTLAQKIVGRACGLPGVPPGTACEPVVSTLGSQDTTGPLNRAELEDLACLGFTADLVLQSFCHTAAYPRPVDIVTQRTLPEFMGARGAVVLRPGDGIIHSWLNRMLLPDQVGTGSDSHTRFPLGISFPAGSGQVAFAAALGVLPLEMPESVLVRFSGQRRAGVTLRDVVHAIPYAARRQGLLTLEKATKRNVFAGRVIEIEGMEELSVDEAFELTDATAERSAAAATIALSEASVVRHLRSCVALLRQLIDDGYQGAAALARRVEAMERWLDRPALLRADPDAPYAAVLPIDLGSITEPLVACPNDPDDVRPLSAVAGTPVDEVFVGSCMTRLDHFRAVGAVLSAAARGAAGPAPVRLWIAPPTKMAERALRDEGCYATFGAAGARTEMPGCSLCMGNQARVAPGATVVSTSTRNFPNRMGRDAQVFLASAEVAAVAGVLGRLPTVAEYREHLDAARDEPVAG